MDEDQQNQPPTPNGADQNGDDTNNGPPADQPAPPQTFSVLFKHQNGFELTFKMKPTTKLGKAMDGFSQRAQRDLKSLRFLLEGIRIQADQTLEHHDVDDDCQVDVFEEQIGGGA